MSDDRYETEKASGTCSDVPPPESASAGDRPMGFDCCGIRMGDAMAACPCVSIMRKHPVVAFAILAVMALAMLAIPTGAILGFIAFLRTL